MSDERVWLRHKETGGYFHCPAAAVDDWQKNGWETAEAPQDINPAVTEQVAWRAEQAAQQSEKSAAKPAPTKEK